MRELKAMLERDVLLPLQEPEVYRRYRVELPNGVLLYGPPGCGKTFIARALAKRLRYNFLEIKPSDLGSVYVHGSQGKIADLFKAAENAAPTMIFFDELDAVMPERGASDDLSHHYASETNEFLVQLNECAKRNILVVGATNRLDRVDRAVRRPGRMDKKIYVGPPDVEARTEAFALHMKDRPQAAIDFVTIAQETDTYSFAEIEHVVTEAARAAIPARRLIVLDDLREAVACNPPGAKHGHSEPD